MAKWIQASLNFQFTATLLHSWNHFLGKRRVWSQYILETLPIQFSSFTWLKRIFSGLGTASKLDEDPHSNASDWDIFDGSNFVTNLKESFASCISPKQGIGPRLTCDPLVISRDFEDTITILNDPRPLRVTDTRPSVKVRVCCRQEPPILPFQVVRSFFLQERMASVKINLTKESLGIVSGEKSLGLKRLERP